MYRLIFAMQGYSYRAEPNAMEDRMKGSRPIHEGTNWGCIHHSSNMPRGRLRTCAQLCCVQGWYCLRCSGSCAGCPSSRSIDHTQASCPQCSHGGPPLASRPISHSGTVKGLSPEDSDQTDCSENPSRFSSESISTREGSTGKAIL